MNIPARFTHQLGIRSRQQRRSTVGNPFQHLSAIGIEAVLEHIYQGNNLVDTAATLDVSVTILRTWIENEGQWGKVEEASTLSADGYLSLGMRLAETATDKFQLDKAKAILEHARWLAARLNKSTYGANELPGAGSTVSYVFNVGEGAQVQVVQNAPHASLRDTDPTNNQPAPATFEIEPDIGPFAEPPDPENQHFALMWEHSDEEG
jgi:hypothetical protein